MYFLLISLAFLLRLPSSTGFLARPFGTIDSIRNLTCFGNGNQSSANVYGGMYCVIFTAYFQSNTSILVQDGIYSDLPFYQYMNNLTILMSYGNPTFPAWALAMDFPKKYGWIRMGRTRCSGFSNTTDVGYGPCTSLPYETFENGTLCVCATDNCNIDMATCINSMNSYRPVAMIPLFSTFSNPISCFDDGGNVTSGYTSYFQCYRYQGVFRYGVNMSLCNAYYATHSVVCSISNNVGGLRQALTIEDYDSVLEYEWHITLFYTAQWQQINATQQGYFVYETATKFLFFLPTFGYPAMESGCFCTTNNCNVDMDTCTAGLNYNYTALYGINATSPSTVTASSSSGMITTTSANATTTTLRTGNSTTIRPTTTQSITTITTTTTIRASSAMVRSNCLLVWLFGITSKLWKIHCTLFD